MPRRRAWWIAAVALALPGAVLTAVRVLPWDIGSPWIQLLSLFPVIVLLTPLALLAALLNRRRIRTLMASALAVLFLAQLGILAPRVVAVESVASDRADGSSASDTGGNALPGRPLTVMALNVGSTGVDTAALLAEARGRKVDVLALPELSPMVLEQLESAGLAAEFPYRELDVDSMDTGSGLFSRFPLESTGRVPGSEFYQSRAVAAVPGVREGVHLTAVHIDSPRPGHTPPWRRELRQLAELQQAVPESAPAILLGDFNASLDHREFRQLVSTGLTDAAQAAGRGLWPTWPENSPMPPIVALDHVLVSNNIGVSGFEAVSILGTDHAAVVVVLRLPQS